ncbi:MAG: cytochrome c [Bryobacteraceae bacterium]
MKKGTEHYTMKMIYRMLGIAAVASAALLAADSGAGKSLYATKCKACHGADGKGNPGIAKAMKVELRPLGSKEVLAKSDADLAKAITDGTGKMKAVKGVTAAQAGDIVAFVRSLK